MTTSGEDVFHLRISPGMYFYMTGPHRTQAEVYGYVMFSAEYANVRVDRDKHVTENLRLRMQEMFMSPELLAALRAPDKTGITYVRITLTRAQLTELLEAWRKHIYECGGHLDPPMWKIYLYEWQMLLAGIEPIVASHVPRGHKKRG